VERLSRWLPGNWIGRNTASSPRERGYDAFVTELSQKLHRGAIGNGGWSVDAGALNPDLFRPDARRMIHEILLGGAQGELPSP
jgi:hypothetical protein